MDPTMAISLLQSYQPGNPGCFSRVEAKSRFSRDPSTIWVEDIWLDCFFLVPKSCNKKNIQNHIKAPSCEPALVWFHVSFSSGSTAVCTRLHLWWNVLDIFCEFDYLDGKIHQTNYQQQQQKHTRIKFQLAMFSGGWGSNTYTIGKMNMEMGKWRGGDPDKGDVCFEIIFKFHSSYSPCISTQGNETCRLFMALQKARAPLCFLIGWLWVCGVSVCHKSFY